MKLVIVHYHLRPGGIRRIIELATPHLVRAFDGAIDEVVVACGEAADRKWNRYFQSRFPEARVEWFLEPAFNYLSEQKGAARPITARIRRALDRLLEGAGARNCLVWTHNPGIGRNLLLTRELTRAAARRGLPLVAHHHDWWFDNRWLRWPEMRRFGLRTLATVAKAVFPAVPNLRHLAINHADAAILQRHFAQRAGWLPNLTEPAPPPAEARLAEARRWLHARLDRDHAPVWILPCRLLRRKNVAETLLLTRWLRPEGWLVTTGGASSADEQDYFDRLAAAAREHHWRLRLAVLAGDESRKPDVTDLLHVSEAVMLTSIQEGFGLPYLEAAATRRPLIARSLPNIAPDLERFGFHFPQYYPELLVEPSLFNCRAERARQERLFGRWRQQVPRSCWQWIGRPALLRAANGGQPVPFSRLTLTAQLEVLTRPVRESWKRCAPLNPFLPEWRERAEGGRLQPTQWPASAADWLGGPAYAQRLKAALTAPAGAAPRDGDAQAAQQSFLRARLDTEHLFPLLWAKRT